jgi:hypothetical protein
LISGTSSTLEKAGTSARGTASQLAEREGFVYVILSIYNRYLMVRSLLPNNLLHNLAVPLAPMPGPSRSNRPSGTLDAPARVRQSDRTIGSSTLPRRSLM